MFDINFQNKDHAEVGVLIHQIHRELHARKAIPVTAPACIRHSAYPLADESDRSRKSVLDIFQKLLKEMEIPSDSVDWEERAGAVEKKFPDGSRLRLIWELHTEFYSYTTILTPSSKSSVKEKTSEPFNLPPFPTTGTKFVDLAINVVPGLELTEEQKSFLCCGIIYGGKVASGHGAVWTTFQVDERGQGKYIVGAGDLTPGRLGRLIRRLVEIENYYHLVLLPLPEYREQIVVLREKEKIIASRSEEIASGLIKRELNSNQEHSWLVNLTQDLADLIQLTERMRYRLSAANSYYAIIEERLMWLREVTGEGYQSIQEFLIARVSPAIRNYRNFIERADALTQQLSSLANMMRTRVNLEMGRRSLQTLQTMKKRVGLQLLLQRTVEGLSLIILSYYLAALVGYIFRALESFQLLPGGTTLWSAITLPVWIAISFFITYRVKSRIKAYTQKGSDE